MAFKSKDFNSLLTAFGNSKFLESVLDAWDIEYLPAISGTEHKMELINDTVVLYSNVYINVSQYIIYTHLKNGLSSSRLKPQVFLPT